MTTKKKAQKAGRGKAAADRNLRRRAERIVADYRNRDIDTRQKLWLALRGIGTGYGTHDELRALVERVERGESLSDFSNVSPERAGVAGDALALINNPAAPPFITGPLMLALHLTSEKTGARLFQEIDGDEGTGDFSPQILARVVEHYRSLQIELEAKKDLPELIGAVLAHPDVPGSVADRLTDALCDLNDSCELYEAPGYVAAILDRHKKGGAAPMKRQMLMPPLRAGQEGKIRQPDHSLCLAGIYPRDVAIIALWQRPADGELAAVFTASAGLLLRRVFYTPGGVRLEAAQPGVTPEEFKRGDFVIFGTITAVVAGALAGCATHAGRRWRR